MIVDFDWKLDTFPESSRMYSRIIEKLITNTGEQNEKAPTESIYPVSAEDLW